MVVVVDIRDIVTRVSLWLVRLDNETKRRLARRSRPARPFLGLVARVLPSGTVVDSSWGGFGRLTARCRPTLTTVICWLLLLWLFWLFWLFWLLWLLFVFLLPTTKTLPSKQSEKVSQQKKDFTIMDFITLAQETDPRRVLRFLDEMLGNDEDVPSSSSSISSSSISSSSSSISSATATSLTSLSSSSSFGTTPDLSSTSTIISTNSSNRPFLSQSAEAELYLLATNFLLYVAMVIITTMVAKIYFPESLERNTGGELGGAGSARSFSYRIARSKEDATAAGEHEDEEGEDNDEYYGSDAEDNDGLLLDDEDVLDSDDDNEQQQQQRRRPRGERALPSSHPLRRSSGNFLEFQQSSLTRLQVLRRLIFCSLMLNITFVAWGALQERMLTRRYPRYTGEYFVYSYALVFTNRFWTLIMSGILWMYLKPRRSQTTVIYEYSFPSISNMLSSWCQYEALRYVSFPSTTLFKSFKLAPVMLMGKILGNKTYPQYDYVVAVLIGVGIAMFMTSTDDLQFGYDYLGEQVSATWTGIMLLFLYLFFDSFTSQFQSRMFQRHRDLSMVELMLATSAFSTVLSLITLIHTKELYPAWNFVTTHSEIHLHFFLFSICSTIGQLFIFYTIRNFGAVVFTLIMTTRILLSIALSCVLYGHTVSATGFFGLMLVLGAVIYRIRRKAQGRQLLKWQGMEDDDKAFELVQEWHEHVDM